MKDAKQGTKSRNTPKFRAELCAEGDAHVGWRVVSDDGLLCMHCTQSEAEMIARACNSHDALADLAANVGGQSDASIDHADINTLRATLREFRAAALKAAQDAGGRL